MISNIVTAEQDLEQVLRAVGSQNGHASNDMDEVVTSIDGTTIINGDVLKTSAVEPSSVDLIVTSPPYNVDIAYDSHLDNDEYGQ